MPLDRTTDAAPSSHAILVAEYTNRLLAASCPLAVALSLVRTASIVVDRDPDARTMIAAEMLEQARYLDSGLVQAPRH